MTKKDFIMLADVFRSTNPTNTDYPAMNDQWAIDVESVADGLKRSNPRFDKERWIGYIKGENGPSGGKITPAQAAWARGLEEYQG